MKKYLAVLTVTVKEYFVYRLNFILWRFRVVLNILIPLFLWSAVFDKNAVIGSYDRTRFISYLLYGNLIGTFVFGTRTFDVSSDINDGRIIVQVPKGKHNLLLYFSKTPIEKAADLISWIAVGVIILLVSRGLNWVNKQLSKWGTRLVSYLVSWLVSGLTS